MLPDFCVDPSEIPCCTTVFDDANLILDAAWDALVLCAGEDACAPIVRFVSAAEPHLAVPDYLCVYLASTNVPLPRNQPSQAKGLMVQQPSMTYSVKLIEGGFPTLESEGTEIDEPDPAAIEFASRHFLGHVESVYRGVFNFFCTKANVGRLKSYTDLRSLGPSGGKIGAQFGLTIETLWR